MGEKAFLTGFIPRSQKTRDKLELGGKALALQEGTEPLFKKASEISQGMLDPDAVKRQDQALLAQLSTALNTLLGPEQKTTPTPRSPR